MNHGADLVAFIDKGRGMKSNDSRIVKTVWYIYFTINIWKKEKVSFFFFFLKIWIWYSKHPCHALQISELQI